jgi:hypothetical protein
MEGNKTHYRVLRSTVVLARNSLALKQIITPELQAAIDQVQAKNYQFDQIADEVLEVLFANFDEEFTSKVRDEYTFYPGAGSVQVHAAAVAICELCGKGDSKETGDNKDHLRIEFQLTNTAGGTDTWCGSTCIINFGLKVDGAATAEEAERLLGMSMRQAVRQFQINAWRAEHPDHTDIPEHYRQLRTQTVMAEGFCRDYFGELLLIGLEPDKLQRIMRNVVRPMKTSSNFYAREGYLTPKKMEAWDAARWALDQTDRARKAIQGALNITDPDTRFAYFANLNEEMEKANAENAA